MVMIASLTSLMLNQGFTYSVRINSAINEYKQQTDTVSQYMNEKGKKVGEDEKVDAYQIHPD